MLSWSSRGGHLKLFEEAAPEGIVIGYYSNSKSNNDKCNQNSLNIDPHNNNSHKKSKNQSAIMIGDSIIKNITPHKLSKKKVYKFTYPGKSVEKIQRKIQSINTDIPASHAIIHCGTKNIPTDQQDTCLKRLGSSVEQ